jgi:hypothetical protein
MAAAGRADIADYGMFSALGQSGIRRTAVASDGYPRLDGHLPHGKRALQCLTSPA